MEIEVRWLDGELGNKLEDATFAEISFSVDDYYITRVDDTRAQTIRNYIRCSAWHLANWFATNWWRLRWEPDFDRSSNDLRWLLSHTLSAAGGGYVWPNLVLSSDGEYLGLDLYADATTSAREPIRYLSSVNARVAVGQFERVVDEFLSSVITRLQALKVDDEGLEDTWKAVLEERFNADLYHHRKLEALCGFDPEAAPPSLIGRLIQSEKIFGTGAIEEVVAEARQSIEEPLDMLSEINSFRTEAFMVQFPTLNWNFDSGEIREPWHIANYLARQARKSWSLKDGPIDNKTLASLLGAEPDRIIDSHSVDSIMPFALQAERNGHYEIYFNKERATTRRFAISRLIGDHLCYQADRLRPATVTKTYRQKLQRAFAQEFLCPIAAIRDELDMSSFGDDDIAEVADKFDVSPLVVRNALINHGVINRRILAGMSP